MSRNWLRSLLGRKQSPTQRTKSTRLDLNRARLEDRVTPANSIIIDTGGLLSIPIGATTFSDTGNYLIDPSALTSSATPITLRSNQDILFLESVNIVTPGVSLLAQARTVFVGNNAAISTATNDLTLSGEHGVIVDPGTSVSTTNGNLSLLGNAGGTNNGYFNGVIVNGNASTSGSGDIVIVGHGGNDSGLDRQRGVFIFGGQIKTTGTGSISITGEGGDGGTTNCVGLSVESGAVVSSVTGAITIHGTGGNGSQAQNAGVVVVTGAKVSAGGIGDLEITGIGGSGTDLNLGIVAVGAGVEISSVNGAMRITGTALDASGFGQNGIWIVGGAAIKTSGFGNLTLTATSASDDASSFALEVGSTIALKGASNSFIADRMNIDGGSSIDADINRVTLRPETPGNNISLGGSDAAATLGLTDAELDNITAGVLQIGDAETGNINVTSSVSPFDVNSLRLQTRGAIVDGTVAESADIVVPNLALIAVKGIGGGDDLNIDAVNLAFVNSSTGLVKVFDHSGGLRIASVDGITTSMSAGAGSLLDSGSISASSPLTIAMNTTISSHFAFQAGNNVAAPGDDLTIVNGVTVSVVSANSCTLSFFAGDDMVFQGTGRVVTSGGEHFVHILTDREFSGADSDGGKLTQDSAATLSVASNHLLIVSDNIGTATTRFHFDVDSLSTSGDFDQFMREANGVALESVFAGVGKNIGNLDLVVDAGDVTVGLIVVTNQASIVASGKIVDGDEFDDILAFNVLISAGAGIASATDPLETATTNLAWNSGTGGIDLVNSGALTITTLSATGISLSGGVGDGSANITVKSPLTVAEDVVMGGDIVLTATESGVPAGDLILNQFAEVTSTGGNVTLNSGDDIVLGSGSLVHAAAADMLIALNAGAGDDDGVGAIVLIGQAFVEATNLAITAMTGIGAVAGGLPTKVSNLAFTNGGAEVTIVNFGPLTIAAVNGITTSTNSGTATILSSTDAVTVAANTVSSGNLTVAASGIAALNADNFNITVNSGITLESTLGGVVLKAADDIAINSGATVTASAAVTGIVDTDSADPGIGGIFTLSGKINAASMSISGGTDADTFNITPSIDTPITIDGDLPDPPATPGDRLNVITTGTTNPTLISTSSVTGLTGEYTFADRKTVSFQRIETLTPAGTDLSITASDGQTSAIPGDKVTYTIVVTNNGPLSVNGAQVSSKYSSFLTGTTYGMSFTGGASGSLVTGSGDIGQVVDMPVGSTVTYIVNGTIISSATGTLDSEFTVTAPADQSDIDPSNNQVIESDTLTPQADISVTNTDSPDPVVAGKNLTYVITVDSNGLSDAQNVQLNNLLPANTTFLSFTTPAGWTPTTPGVGSGGTVTATRTTFERSLASQVFTLVVRVNANTPKNTIIENKATVGTSTTDPTPGNDSITTTTETAVAPLPLVVGADAGGGPHVQVYDPVTGNLALSFFAFDPGFKGGVRVAAGDVTGDGVADILAAAGPGGGPHVKVFDGVTGTTVRSFFAFGNFGGGVFVAAGDVNNDGFADIITGADAGGGAHVKAFSGQDGSLLASFFAYNGGFTGGVRVAAGDVDGDNFADIITGAGPGGGPHVKAFSGANGSLLRSFFAFDAFVTSGVYVGGGDLNDDGKAEIIAGAGSSPIVKVFDGVTSNVLANFFAYGGNFNGAVRVGVADVGGDGQLDLLTGAGPGGAPHLRAFNGLTYAPLKSFFAFDPAFLGGVFVG